MVSISTWHHIGLVPGFALVRHQITEFWVPSGMRRAAPHGRWSGKPVPAATVAVAQLVMHPEPRGPPDGTARPKDDANRQQRGTEPRVWAGGAQAAGLRDSLSLVPRQAPHSLAVRSLLTGALPLTGGPGWTPTLDAAIFTSGIWLHGIVPRQP